MRFKLEEILEIVAVVVITLNTLAFSVGLVNAVVNRLAD